jgi:hypothetical protein
LLLPELVKKHVCVLRSLLCCYKLTVSAYTVQRRIAAEANLKRDNTNVTGDDTDGVPGDHESRKKDENCKEAKKIEK